MGKGMILFGRFIKKTVTHSASSQHTKSMKVWLLMKFILSMNWKAKHCHIIHSKQSQWFSKTKSYSFPDRYLLSTFYLNYITLHKTSHTLFLKLFKFDDIDCNLSSIFLPTKSWKSCSENLKSTFFTMYPELPKLQKNRRIYVPNWGLEANCIYWDLNSIDSDFTFQTVLVIRKILCNNISLVVEF